MPTRRALLARSALAATAGGLALTRPAAAAPQAPAPQGDDVGYLQFGAVAADTTVALLSLLLAQKGQFAGAERRALARVRSAQVVVLRRLNAALGPDALSPDDFSGRFPASARERRDPALALAGELLDLAVGVALSGAAYASDAGTRGLLARVVASDVAQASALGALRGRAPSPGLPGPRSLEVAGARLDDLITAPDAPEDTP